MPTLDDFLRTLLRSPESTPVLIRVNTGNDQLTYELTVGELATVVLAETDTRRTTVLGQDAATQWIVHPSGVNQPEIMVTSAELVHSLPYCQAPVENVETVKMVVTADGLNVRAVPYSVPYNKAITTLARGTEVTVKVSTDMWKQLVAPDAYKNAWVHGDYLAPKV
jgi:hypothetical protein